MNQREYIMSIHTNLEGRGPIEVDVSDLESDFEKAVRGLRRNESLLVFLRTLDADKPCPVRPYQGYTNQVAIQKLLVEIAYLKRLLTYLSITDDWVTRKMEAHIKRRREQEESTERCNKQQRLE